MSDRPADISPAVREFYSLCRWKARMFLGWNVGLTTFEAFINGWRFSNSEFHRQFYPSGMKRLRLVFIPDGFNEYVADHYRASRSERNCFSLINQNEAGEIAALEKFWELLDGYLVSLGYEPIPLREKAEGVRHGDGVRQIFNSDLERLADSYMRTFNGAPWFDEWDIKTAYDRLRDLYRSAGFYGYAVWQEGKPLGAVMGVMEKYFDGDVFRIIELWTDPEQRGKGLGRRLLDEMKSWVGARGGVRMYLITLKTTETVGFYEHCGFNVDSGMCVMSLSEDSAAKPTKGE